MSDCKERFRKNVAAIEELAQHSPLSLIPAQNVLVFFSSRLGVASILERQFMNLMRDLSLEEGMSLQVTDDDIEALFDVLDFDNIGLLSHAHWVSATPIFFKVNTDSLAMYKQVFNELDSNTSGGLTVEELAK